MKSQFKFAENSLLATVFLVPLGIAPGLSLDPVNVPKLGILALLAFTSFFAAMNLNIWLNLSRLTKIVLVSVFLSLLIPFFFSGSNLTVQFYGAFGRNTGFLAYLSLFLAGIVGYLLGNKELKVKVLKATLLSSCISSLYAVLQFLDWDFLAWANAYPGSFSTFGNPNFLGASSGISFIISSILLSSGNSKKYNINSLLLCFATGTFFVAAVASNSTQGLILLSMGLIFSMTTLVFNRFKIHYRLFMPISVISLFLLSILAIFFIFIKESGMSSEIRNSLEIRFIYMHAAVRMILSSPIYGFGFDMYGDWYRLYRSDVAYFGGDKGEVADSAHNLFLDLGVNGGVPLMVIVISLLGIAFKRMHVFMRKVNQIDSISLALFGGLVGYAAQSLISINNLGLAVLGWIYTGLLLQQQDSSSDNLIRFRSGQMRKHTSMVFVGIALAISLVTPIVKKDISIWQTKARNEVREFARNADSFPHLPFYYNYASSILDSAGYMGLASKLGIESVKRFPDTYAVLENVISLSAVDSSFKSKVSQRMKFLNPARK